MSSDTSDRPYYDHYDVNVGRDPHPAFRRLRDEAPLYYNEKRDVYALSRYADIERAFLDVETFQSGRGVTLELIRNASRIPPGSVIFEDPPVHTIHRALISRMFTPKKVAALEPRIRAFCAEILDQRLADRRFDFITDLAMNVPMRVIGFLLGIPEHEQELFRDFFTEASEHLDEEGNPHGSGESIFSTELFASYLDYREQHPSDDVTTEVMNAEFVDEHGATRRLTREEMLMCINVLAAAGNETTGRLMGWTGKLLADHPDQRRELVADPALIPGAIDEILRFEPPALQTCRYVGRDVELYGQTVPEGSVMLLLLASANRDERKHVDPDRFDIHRKGPHMSFAFGPHFCIGAPLARMEGRIVLEEVLQRFPEWEIDTDRAKLEVTAEFRGWSRLPAVAV